MANEQANWPPPEFARRAYSRVAWWTWAAAIAVYFLADPVLTITTLELASQVPCATAWEANPVSAAVLDALGYPGLFIQKGVLLAFYAALWRYFPSVGVPRDPWRIIVPTLPLFSGIHLAAVHLGNIQSIATCTV